MGTNGDDLIKLLRQGWRGDTASDLMQEAAERLIEQEKANAAMEAEIRRVRAYAARMGFMRVEPSTDGLRRAITGEEQ